MRRRYPSVPLVGVGAVVLLDNKILLVRRGNPPGKGLWSIPGGLVKVNETLEEAVIRELYEETKIKGRVIGPIDIFQVIIKDENDKVKYHYILIDFLMKPEKENVNPIPSTDALSAEFFDIETALRLNLTKPTRMLLEQIKKNEMKIVPMFSTIVRDV